MKKILSILLACIFISSIISGCGSQNGTTDQSTSTAAVSNAASTTNSETQSAEPVKISFLSKASSRAEIFKTVVDNFNNANPDIIVEFESPAQNTDTVLQSRLATNNPPDLTTHITGQGTKPFVEGNQIIDVTNEAFMQKIIPAVRDMMKYDGKNYCIPLDCQAFGVYYNKQLFQKAGIQEFPKTFDELSNAVGKLKDAGIVPFSQSLVDDYIMGQVVDIGGSPLLTGLITGKLDAFQKGDFTFAGPEMESTLNVTDLILKNLGKNEDKADTSKQYSDFASGKAAMMVDGSWALMQLRELNKDLDADFAVLPVSNNAEESKFPVFYALSLNVMTGKNMDAVSKFVDYLLDPKANSVYYDSIGVPTAVADAKDAKIDPMAVTLRDTVVNGNIVSWMSAYEPAGMSQEIHKQIQVYSLDAYSGKTPSHEDLIKQIDGALKNATASK